MDLQHFFDHWNLVENPFQAEEARNDAVYARTMEAAITHPDFQKIYGSPENPSTSIVFGEKGSGKTAMRLLIERRLEAHNLNHPGKKVWIIRYDDLNPILDRMAHHSKGKNPQQCLGEMRLQDHQDAILSLAITQLIDAIVEEQGSREQKQLRRSLRKMTRQQRMDLGVLAVLYDQPRHGQRADRWKRLKSFLRLRTLGTRRVHGTLTLGFGAASLLALGVWHFTDSLSWEWQLAGIAAAIGFIGLGLGWLVRSWKKFFRARGIHREVRTVEHESANLREALWDLPEDQGTLHLIPDQEDQDKRYQATQRFLRLLEPMGYHSLIVLVDRIDEPAMINSDDQRMRSLIWPMMNNKFLQQERVGIKMLLPIELGQLLETETTEFQRQARLDKQNLINPLRWTGATLYDLCTSRFRSCQSGKTDRIEELKDLFEDDVEHRDLVDALDQMHQPRDAFKFLYAVLLRHCQNTPGDAGQYQIPKLTLEYVRREQSQRVMNLYRGVNQG